MDPIKNLIISLSIAVLGAAAVSMIIATHVIPSMTIKAPANVPSNEPSYGRAQAESESCQGGVCTYRFTQSMTQGASTTCNWQTPAATSTVRIAARFTIASSSAMQVEFGKSEGPMATTTSLGKFAVAANVQATLISSTTNALSDSGIDPIFVAAPSTWLAVKLPKGTTGTVPTGTCNFEATTLP